MIHLSKRLMAVAAMVTPGSHPADVGCDHGYIPIYLVQNKIAETVLAMDINEGPLLRAKENIKACGLDSQITVRLSDGLCQYLPGEADCLIIAGMGGLLIGKILAKAADSGVLSDFSQLVLSPHSDIALVRKKLHALDYCIDKETMVIDAGKYYTVIHAVKGLERYDREEEYVYGQYLIKKRHPVLKDYASHTLRAKRELAKKLESISTPKALEYIPKLKKEIENLEYVLSQFQTGE